MRTTNRLIGSAIPRVEDLRFLRGAGEFVADIAREGQLHAFILRSAIAHGRIRRIDTQKALRMPGVHAVVTASDLPQPIATIKVSAVITAINRVDRIGSSPFSKLLVWHQ